MRAYPFAKHHRKSILKGYYRLLETQGIPMKKNNLLLLLCLIFLSQEAQPKNSIHLEFSYLPLITVGGLAYSLWKTKGLLTEKLPYNATLEEIQVFKFRRTRETKKMLSGLLIATTAFVIDKAIDITQALIKQKIS